MKNNWLRRIIGGLSFTTALFVFQACYGTPQDFGADLYLEGEVKAKTTGLPIKGINVAVPDTKQYVITDESGRFGFYTNSSQNIRIVFEDTDALENGSFKSKDTIVSGLTDHLYLKIHLEEK
jgi:putative lipoprotein (rSAM/lipoprotein system)